MKVRTFYDRFILVLCSVLFTVSVIACSFCPVDVFADDVVPYGDIASLIRQFERESKQGMDDLQQAIQTDIENGNLDATSAYGQQVMKAYVMQLVAVSSPELMTLYNAANYAEGEAQEWIDWYNSHQTITVSGSSSSGFYKDNTGDIKIISISPVASGLIISGDGFSFNMDFIDADSNNHSTDISCSSSVSGNVVTLRYTTTNSIGRNIPNPTPYGSLNGSPVTVPSKSYWISSEMWLNKFSPLSLRYQVNTSSIPVFSSRSYDFTYFLGWSSNSVMGYAQSYDLNPITIDSSDPWDIYNTVLPQIKQECPDVTNNYYIFNDGYIPAQPPTDPPEPTSPPGDLVLPTYGELVTEVSSYYVTDESGETVTDESGEPLTETTMIPVTSATVENGNYLFKIPTLPSIYMTDTGELNISLPVKYASICGGLFSACYDVLDSSGILGVLPFLVGMAVIVYVIYKVGG